MTCDGTSRRGGRCSSQLAASIVRVALRDHLSRVDGDRRSSHGRLLPCVCCGYVTLSQRDDSCEICSVCFWEDEKTALRWPRDPSGGANHVSLEQAQRNFATFGASGNNGSDSWYGLPATAPYASPVSAPLDPRRDRVETPVGATMARLAATYRRVLLVAHEPIGCGQGNRVPPVRAATTRPP